MLLTDEINIPCTEVYFTKFNIPTVEFPIKEQLFDDKLTELSDESQMFKCKNITFKGIKNKYKKIRPFLSLIKFLTRIKEKYNPDPHSIHIMFFVTNVIHKHYSHILDMFDFISNITIYTNNNISIPSNRNIELVKYSILKDEFIANPKLNSNVITIFEFERINSVEMLKLQEDLISVIQPMAASIQFRLPYTNKVDIEYIEYMNGDIVLEPFSNINCNETRLFWYKDKHDIVKYDIKSYDRKLSYINVKVRQDKVWKLNESSTYNTTFDLCYSHYIVNHYNEVFDKSCTIEQLKSKIDNDLYTPPWKKRLNN